MGIPAANGPQTSEIFSLFVMEEATSPDEGLDRFLARFLREASSWFGADGVSVFLLDRQGTRYELSGQYGPLSKIPPGVSLKSGVGVAGKAIETGRPQILQGSEHRAEIGTSMIIPLIDARSRCIGVLNLARGLRSEPFVIDDLEEAKTLAQHLSLAVTNARLIHESRHVNDMLKVVLGHLGFGLLSMDSDSRVTHFNSELVMMLGKVPGIGESLAFYLFDCHPDFMEAIGSAAQEGLSGRRFRTRLHTNQRVFTVNASPLESRGVTIAIQDVTELEHAQREHERLQRLAEVGQMTATIAHEIRNPLTGIRSAAKMISDNPELAEEFASIIEDESVKLASLCDDFLEFARPLKLEVARAHLHVPVRSVVASMKPLFDDAGVELTCDIDEGTQPLLLDTRRVEQVVRNLLQNALQATPRDGLVTITVQPNLIAVSDTGCGMDDLQLGRLFSPFFTTKTKGTGLGLSTVRKMVEAHQAIIEVQSSLGVGTCFTIRFNQEVNR